MVDVQMSKQADPLLSSYRLRVHPLRDRRLGLLDPWGESRHDLAARRCDEAEAAVHQRLLSRRVRGLVWDGDLLVREEAA